VIIQPAPTAGARIGGEVYQQRYQPLDESQLQLDCGATIHELAAALV
jgi:hypothetical protein